MSSCSVPCLMEGLIPRKGGGHASTEEVPGGTSAASDQARVGGSRAGAVVVLERSSDAHRSGQIEILAVSRCQEAKWADGRSIRAEQPSGGTKAKLNLSLGLVGIVTCRDLTRAAELGDATNQERRLVP